jgi:(2Fe-2S) ferredoxin
MRENLEIRRVKICRGCCCGVKTGQKNGAELREQALLMLEGAGIQVERTECLGPCDQGDIVVVLPTPSERRRGYKPIWLGRMHSFTLTTLLAELLLKGFFESFEKYPELKERKIQPPRKKKKEIYDVQKYA